MYTATRHDSDNSVAGHDDGIGLNARGDHGAINGSRRRDSWNELGGSHDAQPEITEGEGVGNRGYRHGRQEIIHCY